MAVESDENLAESLIDEEEMEIAMNSPVATMIPEENYEVIKQGIATGSFNFGRKNNRHEHESDAKALAGLCEPMQKRHKKTIFTPVRDEEESKADREKANEGNVNLAKGYYGKFH